MTAPQRTVPSRAVGTPRIPLISLSRSTLAWVSELGKQKSSPILIPAENTFMLILLGFALALMLSSEVLCSVRNHG